jgi:hypothetical protein
MKVMAEIKIRYGIEPLSKEWGSFYSTSKYIDVENFNAIDCIAALALTHGGYKPNEELDFALRDAESMLKVESYDKGKWDMPEIKTTHTFGPFRPWMPWVFSAKDQFKIVTVSKMGEQRDVYGEEEINFIAFPESLKGLEKLDIEDTSAILGL